MAAVWWRISSRLSIRRGVCQGLVNSAGLELGLNLLYSWKGVWKFGYVFILTVRAAGHTRQDDDGTEHFMLIYFTLVILATVSPYPFTVWLYFMEDLHIYKHLYYCLQTFLPETAAAFLWMTVISTLMSIWMFLAYAFLFLIGAMMTVYVVSQTFWMIKLREMW